MQKVFQMAGQYSGGRIISVLEGGYSLAKLPELIIDHIRILLDLEHSD
jgi:acetoin utilization deacetylase AcuC-like enzyme